MRKIIVIGGGAAGMMAAVAAAKQGASVTLLEKNEKTGKKIYITEREGAMSPMPVNRKTFSDM